jgi:diguanylate cyclase (GGDEF)-like protein
VSANASLSENEKAEIDTLIEALHKAEQRIEELTGGQVDTVANRQGRTTLLRLAQVQLRESAAVKQAAILDALPAHIALLDAQGRIVSVNHAWRQFSGPNAIHGVGYELGVNYVQVCNGSGGSEAFEYRQIAHGVQSVLDGDAKSFSIEYPLHADAQGRWFLLSVTPLTDDLAGGAVVMHLDVTLRKRGDIKIQHLNRMFAMLSQISALTVRVGERQELFREACRIAVEVGGFQMAWIGVIDQKTFDGRVAAWYGGRETDIERIRLTARVDTPYSERPACRAVRLSQPVICNDIATDLSLAAIRDQLLERGHRSVGCFPLTMRGRPDAVLTLYSTQCRAFDDEETRLLSELTANLSFALDHVEKQERLNYLAYYDELTGLANRNLFLERVAQHMRSAVRSEGKLALVLIDLQRFKNINLSFGRAAGDMLLRQVAQWLTVNFGDANLLARMGADHFAVVLTDFKRKSGLTQRIEQSMDALLKHPFSLNDAAFHLACKVGVAIFPDNGADADILFKNAEAALVRAKVAGDRYLFYAERMTATMVGRLTMENQLREALEKQQFVLHYQPKVSLLTGNLTGAEALIRWNNPLTGLMRPAEFIPILEETGLIHEVGRWALQRAIKDHLSWRAAGLPAVRIAANVSALQLRSRSFIDEIREAIGVDPSAAAGLELEITESLIMADVQFSTSSLKAIRATGVTIAIDDFGTGYSSLRYLSKLPVDTLKIDRSFVSDMTEGNQGLSLVSTIINLAHSLDLKVVAEGVETQQQSELLRGLRCDEMQGYLLSRPVPKEIFEQTFLTSPPAKL